MWHLFFVKWLLLCSSFFKFLRNFLCFVPAKEEGDSFVRFTFYFQFTYKYSIWIYLYLSFIFSIFERGLCGQYCLCHSCPQDSGLENSFPFHVFFFSKVFSLALLKFLAVREHSLISNLLFECKSSFIWYLQHPSFWNNVNFFLLI